MEQIKLDDLSASRQNIATLLIDLAILAGIYGMVSFSHLIAFPIYKLEPMKLFLLVAILFSSRGNALFMAVTIPLTSTFLSGHPIFPKNLLIGIELMVFAGMLTSSSSLLNSTTYKLLAALILSKLVYYGSKALIIALGWINMNLFSTSLTIQIQGALIVFLGYWFLSKLSRGQGDS